VREAKALVASAWDWSRGKTPRQHKFLDLSTGTYRAPDPYLRVEPMPPARISFSAGSRKIDLDDDAANLKHEQLKLDT
jgi:hypothetical protein